MSWKADGCLCSRRHLHSFIVRVIESNKSSANESTQSPHWGARLEPRSRRLSGSPTTGFSTFAHQPQMFVNGDRRLRRLTCQSPWIPSQARCGCRGELCDEDLMRSWFMHGCVKEVGFHGGKNPRTPSHTYIHTYIYTYTVYSGMNNQSLCLCLISAANHGAGLGRGFFCLS